MKVYFVRLAEPPVNTDPFVGVFAAQNVFKLGLIVDEWVSPLECEYREVPSGGISWSPMFMPNFSDSWIYLVEEDEGWRRFSKRWINQYFTWMGSLPQKPNNGENYAERLPEKSH